MLESGVHSKIENLVLWARPEKIGFAVKNAVGRLEYWNVGILGLVELDLFFIGLAAIQKNKIRPISIFDPQYSIFPSFRYSMGYLAVKTTPLG